MTIVIENNREQLQYQIFKAGDLAGFVQYSMSGSDMWVLYTSMKRHFKSAVLADILMHHVLSDAHSSRLAVLPFCPALRTFIAEHPEFANLVPAEWQQRVPALAHATPGGEMKASLDFVRLTGSRRSRLQETTLDSPDVAEYTGSIPVQVPETDPGAPGVAAQRSGG
ncbi:GNAT family N-acetyltransferase [Arthrobacter sp. JSM 101049]|uniref:GNAT family N-acetyltransferase n=1 Tax=Arthrobacter sp. JSM 101049 TaxID=929097 RepID=UPI0035653B5E